MVSVLTQEFFLSTLSEMSMFPSNPQTNEGRLPPHFSHAPSLSNSPGLGLFLLLMQSPKSTGSHQMLPLKLSCEKFCEAGPGFLILEMLPKADFCFHVILGTRWSSG